MRSDQFSVIVKYQLGANVYEEDFTCLLPTNEIAR